MSLIFPALVVGLILGITGAGGGIVLVPSLLYLVHQTPEEAVAHSLVIVFAISSIAVLSEIRSRRVKFREAIPFSISGMLGSYIGAHYLSHWVPNTVRIAIFIIFVLGVSGTMVKDALFPTQLSSGKKPAHPMVLLIIGYFSGTLAGLLGVGGGFIVVPALTVFGAFTMANAVATSLLVISLNSLGGILGNLGKISFQIPVVLTFTGIGLLSARIGVHVRTQLPEKGFKLGFAAFLIVMCGMMLWDNFFR